MDEKLILDNMGLVYWTARRYGAMLEPEEADAICMLKLCEAAVKFNPERGIKFGSYAAFVMRNAMIDEARKETHYKRTKREGRRPVSLEELLERYEYDAPDAPVELECEHAIHDYLPYMRNLTVKELKVLYLRFVKGRTLRQTGAEMGLTNGRIQQIQRKALHKLRLHRAVHA